MPMSKSRQRQFLYLIIIFTVILISCDSAAEEAPVPENCFCDPDRVAIYLEWAAANYPELTKLRTIGKSESGRDIYALEISDNPGITEKEPTVLINGAIHGNEQIAAGIPLKMIEYLLQGYNANDADALYIVNNLKLHFIPAFNPDGLAVSKRYNENNVDLNRNFGYNWDEEQSYSGKAAFDQSESAAIRADFDEYGYCLSLNLHTAASMQYIGIYAPWDAFDKYDVTDFITDYLPNYTMIENIGTEYVSTVTGTELFPFEQYFHYQEGAEWYSFFGSMSDWALGIHGTVSYSIELYGDQDFTINDSDILDQCWTAHKDAILDIVKTAALGSGGIITDSDGTPLSGANITLSGTSSRSFTPIPYPALKGSSDDNGLFRLLTEAGTYNIAIQKTGYQLHEATVIVDSSGKTSLAGGSASLFPKYQLSK